MPLLCVPTRSLCNFFVRVAYLLLRESNKAQGPMQVSEMHERMQKLNKSPRERSYLVKKIKERCNKMTSQEVTHLSIVFAQACLIIEFWWNSVH